MYQKDVKLNNENKIFSKIYKIEETFTISEICKLVDMTFPTVKRVFYNFLQKDIIKEFRMSKSSVGRRAVEYIFNSDFCFLIGTKIYDDHQTIILTNARGKIIKSSVFENIENNLLDFLTENLISFLDELSVGIRERILGIGIAIPGIYNKEDNFIELSLTKTYSGNIKQELEEKLGYKIFIENEANLSVLAEAVLGKYGELKDFTVISINENLNSSNFLKMSGQNEEFFFKASRTEHMILDKKSGDTYGNHISFKSLEKNINTQLNCGEKISVDDFFRRDDLLNSEKGRLVLDDFVDHLALLIKNVIFLYNPSKIIICGLVANYEILILEKLKNKIYTDNNLFYRGKETLCFSEFRGNSSIVGAAIFPLVDSMM